MSNLETMLSREYWTTQEGRKVFPHEFEDEHLANTIRFLHMSTKRFRLENARNLCEIIHRTGHTHTDIEVYYRTYKRQMDYALGDLDEKQWLSENSKIYRMLIEEAKFRGVDYSDKPTKVKYTGNVKVKNDLRSKFKYLFNNV